MEEADKLLKPTKVSPMVKAPLISRLFFCWVLPIFCGNKQKSEFYAPLKSHKSKNLGDKFEKTWTECQNTTNPKLWLVIWKIFRLEILAMTVMFVLSEFVFKFSQPWLIGSLMSCYSNVTKISSECYLNGLTIITMNFCSVIISHFYLLRVLHLGMKIRIGCTSLIYRKVLQVKKHDFSRININVINLISNDANRLDSAVMHLIQFPIALVESALIAYFLYDSAGSSTLTGIALLTLFIPVQMYMGKLTTSFRQKAATKTDLRIKMIDEILTGIKSIKVFAWENFVSNNIQKIRKHEIHEIKKTSLCRALNTSFMLFLNRVAVFLAIATHYLTQNEISAKYVFIVSSFYAILRQSLTVYLPFGIQNVSETKVALNRIEQFLSMETRKIDEEGEGAIGVILKGASFKWTDYVFKNVNFEASDNKLVVLKGPVGSGKSTLLYTILKELEISEGTIKVNGSISYASQEPWIFSGSIRQNILFGSKYLEKKYEKVIEVCQLEEDFLVFDKGDQTLVGENGSLLSGGQKTRINLARAIYKDTNIFLLDDPFAGLDVKVARKIFTDCILNFLRSKCKILVVQDTSFVEPFADKIYHLKNAIITEIAQSKKIEFSFDAIKTENSKSVFQKKEKTTEKKIEQAPTKHIFRKYVSSTGHISKFSFAILLFLMTQIFASSSDYFVAFWVNHRTQQIYLYIYIFIIAALVVFSISKSIYFFLLCLKASKNLHNTMFASVIRAPLSFFAFNSTGQTLNRFSKDVGLTDEILPPLLNDTIQIFFIVVGSVFLVTLVNVWMILPTIAIFVLLYRFKIMYLRNSKRMKRIESEARSPIYSYMQATIKGLPTIRTFKMEKTLKSEFDIHQDLHSSAFYMFLTYSRAFGFWLDLSCVIYTAIAIIAIMLLDSAAGDVGLSITQSINLIGVLQYGIRQWSELENQMVSVERIIEYSTFQESVKNSQNLNWPNGKIVFENVSLTYPENNTEALKSINFEIKPSEKIGIVGRTGAGKSSLISALLHLYSFQGIIKIDEVNTKETSLQDLRSKITVIPQEPLLFSGYLRDNVDPFREFEDATIWQIFEEVRLKSLISQTRDNLYHKVVDKGSNFSIGQRQLICLARALLKKNKIIVIDEATDSVDFETEKIIRETILEKFQECTILTVAHKLETVMHSDRILVMENGKVIEFDSPVNLLKNQNSFSKFFEESTTQNNLQRVF